MKVLRPIQEKDLPQFIQLANDANIGLTNLPKDKTLLQKKLYKSIDSFAKQVSNPQDEYYIFVLEDLETRSIVGISAIAAVAGEGSPLYFYRKEFLTAESPIEQVIKKIPILSPISYVRGPTEICSLFLHPDFRQHGLGKLLSLGRFLFIAQQPNRFTNSIFAELRGFIENDLSPFWEMVGKHFFNTSLQQALEMLKYGKSFIPYFLPKYPIYLSLLPHEAQRVIGSTHIHTKAALNMLLAEGFEVTDEVDIFDAGPKLRILKDDVRTIKISKRAKIVSISDIPIETPMQLIAKDDIDFRATIAALIFRTEDQCSIEEEVAKALKVGIGDTVRYAPLHQAGAS